MSRSFIQFHRYIQKEKEEIRQPFHEAALESDKVTATVRDEAMEEMEKWLHLWIDEMTTS